MSDTLAKAAAALAGPAAAPLAATLPNDGSVPHQRFDEAKIDEAIAGRGTTQGQSGVVQSATGAGIYTAPPPTSAPALSFATIHSAIDKIQSGLDKAAADIASATGQITGQSPKLASTRSGKDTPAGVLPSLAFRLTDLANSTAALEAQIAGLVASLA